jgi:hypothetical protein
MDFSMTFTRRGFLLALVLLAAGYNNCHAQQAAPGACAMPSFSTVVHDPNVFSEQQEERLGEILETYDAVKQEAKSNPALAAKLNALGSGQEKKASYVIQVTDALNRQSSGRSPG